MFMQGWSMLWSAVISPFPDSLSKSYERLRTVSHLIQGAIICFSMVAVQHQMEIQAAICLVRAIRLRFVVVVIGWIYIPMAFSTIF
jgi:hypothetical protein